MLKLLSNLNNCIRWDVTVAAGSWPLISGTTGTFVNFDATGAIQPAADTTSAAMVWSEGNRDGTAGFSPDITGNGKLTLLGGGFRCLTDQCGTLVAGAAVKVGVDGKLVADGVGTISSIGYCTAIDVAVSQSVNGVQSSVDCAEVVIY